MSLRPFGMKAAERASSARELLEIIVDLRDRGMREPLPLYCVTSHRYAEAVNRDSEFPDEDASNAWTSDFGWPKEDQDAEHVLVLGGVRPFEDILAFPPAVGEDGPGWPSGEKTRFGRLARRLWDPVFAALARSRS
jgi:exodeoxyribonuclease V gamma subunit